MIDQLLNRIQSLPLINKINLRFEYRIWLNFSCVALMLLWLGIALLTTKYSDPWFAYHTITGHHLYDILFSFTIPFFYIWIKRGLRPLWSLMIIGFIVATNEIAWWITYYIDHYIINNTNYYLPNGITNQYLQFQALEHLTIFNFTGMAYIIVIALFFYSFKIKWYVLVFYFGMLFDIYLYWLSIGFPITIDFSGITTLYLNYNTNMIENLHWVIPSTLFILMLILTRFFEQNSKLKGLPLIIFRLYFKGSSFKDYKANTQKLIDLDKFLLDNPHYRNGSCDKHIACAEYNTIPFILIDEQRTL